MVARGALIRAGVKWFDICSCPVIADVIRLALSCSLADGNSVG